MSDLITGMLEDIKELCSRCNMCDKCKLTDAEDKIKCLEEERNTIGLYDLTFIVNMDQSVLAAQVRGKNMKAFKKKDCKRKSWIVPHAEVKRIYNITVKDK